MPLKLSRVGVSPTRAAVAFATIGIAEAAATDVFSAATDSPLTD
jgi:hypothetical protein